jgi:hypothetical protein
MAFGGMEALRGEGLRVPDDASVVGFDDVPLREWPSHALTTVRHPVQEMVAAAIDMVGLGAVSARRPTHKTDRGHAGGASLDHGQPVARFEKAEHALGRLTNR